MICKCGCFVGVCLVCIVFVIIGEWVMVVVGLVVIKDVLVYVLVVGVLVCCIKWVGCFGFLLDFDGENKWIDLCIGDWFIEDFVIDMLILVSEGE